MDGCGAGGGAGAQELGVRGVGSVARGEWWGAGAAGMEGDAPGATRGRQQQAKRCRGGRRRQQTAARGVRKSAGGQKRALREQRGGALEW